MVTSVTCFAFPADWGLGFPAKFPDPRGLANSHSGLKHEVFALILLHARHCCQVNYQLI